MTHDDTGDIRDLLDSAVPDAPDVTPGERAAAVATRGRAARRRNRLVLAASVVLVAGVAVGVPLATHGDNGATPQVTAPDPSSPSPSAPTVAACPAEPVPAASTTDTLDGVVALRLCPAVTSASLGNNVTVGELTTTPLTSGVDDFVADVRALPPYHLEDFCALAEIATDPWALVLTDADGTTTTIASTVRVCSSVMIDGVERGAKDVLHLVDTALAAQALTPLDADSCGRGLADPSSYDYAGDLTAYEPVAALFCDAPGDSPESTSRFTATVLDRWSATELWSSIRLRTTPEPSSDLLCIDYGPQRVLVLIDAAGQRVSLGDLRCSGEFTWSGGTWLPGTRAEHLLSDDLG